MPPAPQQHCASYYAATAHAQPEHAPLQGERHSDVCVIGAGFTGLATALELAERGYKVSVLEANRVGWGASGRNGGQMIDGISGEERLARAPAPNAAALVKQMRREGNMIIRERIEKYQIDCDLKYGYMDAAIKPRHYRELEESYAALQKSDYPYEYRLVTRANMPETLGTQAYIGGLIYMGDGHLHPLNLCLGEARAAIEQGVRIYERSPVVRIRHGARPDVHTANGKVSCDFVALAGNAYHQLEQRRLGGVVFPAGTYIIATEPLSPEQAKAINPLDLAVCDLNYMLDYFRLSADKRLLFGGRCNYSGREPRSIRQSILPRMLKIYPQLRAVRIDYQWGGKIGVVVNRVPHVGRVDNNIYYAQGYSGHGVNVTHIVGRVLAEAIRGSCERFDVFAKVKHRRIPGGRWLGNQLVALGMLYYRLLDAL